MKIVSILKTSPEYTPQIAQWLHRQLGGYDTVCLTDAGEIEGVSTIPLEHNWPGWWAKMELFNPEGSLGGEDLLFLDMDTLIRKEIDLLLEAGPFTMLRDWYSPEIFNSSIMRIPANSKQIIWERWMKKPLVHIGNYSSRRVGDQQFLSDVSNPVAWQDILPDKYLISYKSHVAAEGDPGYNGCRSKGDGTVPSQTHAVCFHGQPRPWNGVSLS